MSCRKASGAARSKAYMQKDLADWSRLAGIKIKHAADSVPSEQRQRRCADASGFSRRASSFRSRPRCSLKPIGAMTMTSRRMPSWPKYASGSASIRRSSFAGIGEQSIKDQLKANTDEAIQRGAFGSPTIYLDKADMYFGNDRLPLIREALMRKKSAA